MLIKDDSIFKLYLSYSLCGFLLLLWNCQKELYVLNSDLAQII